MNDNHLVGLVNVIVKSIRQGVVVLDNNNHIIEINEKAAKILGIESSDVYKTDIRNLFKEDINEYNSKKTVTLADGRKIRIRIVCRFDDDYKYKPRIFIKIS